MWSVLLGICALACPISMLAMMLMMRRRRSHDLPADPAARRPTPRGDVSGEE
jgi:hypothetical protein